jgi:hypothetical protein
MAGNAFLVANGYVGAVAEVTRGTTPGSGTAFWIPTENPAVVPMQTFLDDKALRGSPVELYDMVQGVRHDELDFKSYLYADTFPVYIKALFGGTDTVTPTTASYSHVIPLLNSASTGSQPLSYSLCVFDGANFFTMPGGQASSLNLTYGAEVAADATVKWITNPYVSATSAPAPFTSLSMTAEHLIPSWDATITIGGSSISYIQSGDMVIDRKTAPIFTMGTASPYTNFAGPISVSGKFTCVVASNADPFSTGTGFALTRAQEAIVLTLTDPNDVHTSINDSISVTMTQAQFHNSKRTLGKTYTELEIEFAAEADTTDATTGYSPLKATIVNGISAAF